MSAVLKYVEARAGAVSLAVLTLLLTRPLYAQLEQPEGKKPFGYTLAKGIADTELPFTQKDSELSLSLHPKLGDVLHESYIRFPFEVKYGFTPKREGKVGYMPFTENPFDSNPTSSDGIISFGLKQRIDTLMESRLAVAMGFEAKIPIDEIPNDHARDSYYTYIPFLVAAYELEDHDEWTLYSNLRYELLDKDHHHWTATDEVPKSLATISPGVIYYPGHDIRYAFEFRYITDRFDGGNDDGIKLVPSVTWYPDEETPFFRSIAGSFELTLSVEFNVSRLPEQAHEGDIGLSLDIDWDLFRKIKRPKNELTD